VTKLTVYVLDRSVVDALKAERVIEKV